ncbi:MAG: 3-phosphoglycerate dehydrogenase [Ruminococcaceae bacterium]|nr:3-phosphoglycerate dehydrogenase [Oscillospiraceae bacterium]
MKNVKLLNKIAKVGTDIFDKTQYNVADDIENPDAIMVRSAAMHDMSFGPELKAIARCGAGVNNIPVDKCAEQGIVVFNTPGANANGVKELAICALLLAARDVVGGVNWANTLAGQENVAKLVEKGKSQFAGNELAGKTLGVIGLGAIGGMVANAAHNLGMKVIGYDPYVTVEGAWRLSRAVRKASSYDEVYAHADYISVHVPSTPETKGMFCEENFAKMNDGVRIINLSRADLVNAADMKAALMSGKVKRYVVDFPTEETINVPGIVAIPHLGASTAESEDNCAVMAAHQLIEYLESGNIKNSVNFPNASMPHDGDARICIMHKNVQNMLAKISAIVSEEGLNIENMLNRSKGDYAYTIIEIIGEIPATVLDKLGALDSIIKINVIK